MEDRGTWSFLKRWKQINRIPKLQFDGYVSSNRWGIVCLEIAISIIYVFYLRLSFWDFCQCVYTACSYLQDHIFECLLTAKKKKCETVTADVTARIYSILYPQGLSTHIMRTACIFPPLILAPSFPFSSFLSILFLSFLKRSLKQIFRLISIEFKLPNTKIRW